MDILWGLTGAGVPNQTLCFLGLTQSGSSLHKLIVSRTNVRNARTGHQKIDKNIVQRIWIASKGKEETQNKKVEGKNKICIKEEHR